MLDSSKTTADQPSLVPAGVVLRGSNMWSTTLLAINHISVVSESGSLVNNPETKSSLPIESAV